MQPDERTTTALLEGLRDADNSAAWSELDGRIRPIVYGFARRRGLDEPSAADAAQETFLTFLRLYRQGKFDPARGRLSCFILSIARYRIEGVRRQQGKHIVGRVHDDLIEIIADDDPLIQIWEEESDAVVLARAMDQLRDSRFDPHTIEMFERVYFNKDDPAAVARTMGVAVDTVYVAKMRCFNRLREIIARLNQAWELI